jgi:predicted nucleic acid-binding protein
LWRSNCATDARRAARNDYSSRRDLLAEINALAFDLPAEAEYGGIRSMLDAAGKPMGGNDLLIAAHAYQQAPQS